VENIGTWFHLSGTKQGTRVQIVKNCSTAHRTSDIDCKLYGLKSLKGRIR
jgi:hypothetical protein